MLADTMVLFVNVLVWHPGHRRGLAPVGKYGHISNRTPLGPWSYQPPTL